MLLNRRHHTFFASVFVLVAACLFVVRCVVWFEMESGYVVQADFKHWKTPQLQSSRAKTPNVPNHVHLGQTPLK